MSLWLALSSCAIMPITWPSSSKIWETQGHDLQQLASLLTMSSLFENLATSRHWQKLESLFCGPGAERQVLITRFCGCFLTTYYFYSPAEPVPIYVVAFWVCGQSDDTCIEKCVFALLSVETPAPSLRNISTDVSLKRTNHALPWSTTISSSENRCRNTTKLPSPQSLHSDTGEKLSECPHCSWITVVQGPPWVTEVNSDRMIQRHSRKLSWIEPISLDRERRYPAEEGKHQKLGIVLPPTHFTREANKGMVSAEFEGLFFLDPEHRMILTSG